MKISLKIIGSVNISGIKQRAFQNKKVAREKLQDVALKKKEMIHEAIFSNIPLFMMIVDSQGNVEEVSSLLLQSAGLSLEDQTLIRGGDLGCRK